jgi:hypothetical protein
MGSKCAAEQSAPVPRFCRTLACSLNNGQIILLTRQLSGAFMGEALIVFLPGKGAAAERFTHGGIGFYGAF